MYRQKMGGGGGGAPSLSTVRGAPQNGDGPDQTDVALMRLVALPRHKKSDATRSPEQSAFEPTTIRSNALECG